VLRRFGLFGEGACSVVVVTLGRFWTLWDHESYVPRHIIPLYVALLLMWRWWTKRPV
jgi:hypothetical protein